MLLSDMVSVTTVAEMNICGREGRGHRAKMCLLPNVHKKCLHTLALGQWVSHGRVSATAITDTEPSYYRNQKPRAGAPIMVYPLSPPLPLFLNTELHYATQAGLKHKILLLAC